MARISHKNNSKTTRKHMQQHTETEHHIVRRSRRGDKAKSNHPAVGDYSVELTGSQKKWCGKFSLEISTKAQLGERLTIAAFDEVFSSEEMRTFNNKNGWTNDNEFYEEQLDFVLRLWGRQRGLGRLQLGVIRDFEGVVVNGYPVEKKTDLERVGEEGCRTLWVHNDNAMLLGRPCNHYSGVKVMRKANMIR
ncbi:hypothetical protein VSDG_06382 [Cytospora chrysosperma]|uniref:Uncharacterized protein n=1 Tax=Cytospora chrysosperma TaxID=252740 RepID=A0A423VPK5_CYTCH|nr:hypothetical protein VSDG_06382 [Valsa sordida]